MRRTFAALLALLALAPAASAGPGYAVVGRDGSGLHRVFDSSSDAPAPLAWTESGLYVLGKRGVEQRALDGRRVRVVPALRDDRGDPVTVSPDARHVFYAGYAAGGGETFAVGPLGARRATTLVRSAVYSASASGWSRDSTKVAVAYVPTFEKRERWRLRVHDVTTGASSRPSRLPGRVFSPLSFDPTGRIVAYATAGRIEYDIALTDVVTGSTRMLTPPGDHAESNFPQWSPDGRWIAAVNGRFGVELIDSATGFRRGLPIGANRFAEYAVWSPDGGALAVRTRNSYGTREGLSIVDVSTGASRVVRPFRRTGASSPLWSPDGRTLVFGVPADCCT